MNIYSLLNSLEDTGCLLKDQQKLGVLGMQVNKVSYTHKIKSKTKKTGIVIHGTGGSTVDGCIASFDPNAISVPFIIDRDGKIYQLYDETYDHYHAGSKFRALSRKTIGIELVNWNHLVKKSDGYYSWVNKRIDNDDVINTNLWRGYIAFKKLLKNNINHYVNCLNISVRNMELKKVLLETISQK